MRDARAILNHSLHVDDYETLGSAVCAGYSACFQLMEKTPALGDFLTGKQQWSYLVRTFVEHSICTAKVDGMNYEFKPNAARNCWHVRYHKNGMAWTAHFVGGGQNKRDMTREAICRAGLAERNLDLFEHEEAERDLDLSYSYFQILHAGYRRLPEQIQIIIPTSSQQTIAAATPLPIVQPPKADVEKVEEEMHINLVIQDNAQGEDDADEEGAAG